jgi:hypothetical protein
MSGAGTADANAVIHEVETMYAAYSGAFNDGDMATVLDHISAPYVMLIGGDQPLVFETAAEVERLFDRLLTGLKARGWARSAATIAQVWPLSDRHAIFLTDVARYRADGSQLDAGRYLYWARGGERNWQITGVTDVVLPYLGPGDFRRG